ncbi:MAG: prepilin-type N-terminal cleavage/methylation domain-containing protein [Fusobacterium sp.]|nr:prepilin-type N-terminal cleavage/methylation domain-containing protein [Fusobacterium sp.]
MKKAFTMAEILLSLTIIGVVAAITLPSLTGNINERTWNTQRKALYARFSQAIALMPALNGYGTLDSTTDTAAETFITAGLSKVLKINNICSDNLEDCGIPTKITTATTQGNLSLDNIKTLKDYNAMFGGSISYNGSIVQAMAFKDVKAAAFETANGESILVYYNPNCQAAMGETASFNLQKKMCANFVYDLNGTKGPNTFGKDIGIITAFYPSDSVVVSPVPVVRSSADVDLPLVQAQRSCREDFDNARLPNREELMAMGVNAPLFGKENLGDHGYQSSTIFDSEKNWHVSLGFGSVYPFAHNGGLVWCINR